MKNELTLHAYDATDSDAAERFDEQAKEALAYSIGLQAVIFLMPLKVHARERRIREQMEEANPNLPAAPVNQMGHQRRLPVAGLVMPYTPNHDTLYSGAALDVSHEPVVLTVPPIEDRYFSVQIGDAYIENQPYIGTRATGTQGGHYAFMHPDWQGELPENVIPYRLPQKQGLCAIRIFTEDESDVAAVNAIQNQFKLCSLSTFGSDNPQPASYERLPSNHKIDGQLEWLEDAWQLLQAAPPATKHAAILTTFATVGLKTTEPFDADKIDPAFQRGLVRAIEAGHDVMRWKAKFRGEQSESRWNVDLVGGSYGFDYLARAEGAVQGLFVHDAAECVYFHTYMDANNEPLDASKRYQLHFNADQLPPTLEKGFWSITMYKADYQYVENAINRYAIKGRAEGLQYNADGSLDICIQNTPPVGMESNWLPSAESGIFRLNYRIYLPAAPLLNLDTVEHFLPPVLRV